jgi:predicted O-methyltransferase YrrM
MSLKCERVALQDRSEFVAFTEIARNENVCSYLEIGCKFGGTVWMMANALPVGSRIVALDLPHGDQSFKDTLPHLKDCMTELSRRGYDARMIIGDSTDQKIIDEATALGPFDLVFIDANHTDPYVRADWKNYGPLGRIVAFHDIADDLNRPTHKMPIQVRPVWNELKVNYQHLEISHCEHHNGIGVIWKT